MSDTPVTIAEIARLCGVKPRTVRRWIESGELRAVPVDRRRVRVRSYDLEATLAATWRARTGGARLDPRSFISRALLQDDGCWRWTMFALWPVLWVAAIVVSVGLGH